MEKNMNKTARITWIDTAKFIGIFCIYLGHFGNSARPFIPFCFYFSCAAFFLFVWIFRVHLLYKKE